MNRQVRDRGTGMRLTERTRKFKGQCIPPPKHVLPVPPSGESV